MRRLSLSTKLFAAALPLIIAVGGLLALTVRSDLDEIARAEGGAELGSVWAPLITAIDALEVEADTVADVDAATADLATSAAEVRRATDQALNDLRTSIEGLDAFEAASAHVTAGRSALSAARRNIDMAEIAPEMTTDDDPLEAYNEASREFVAVGQLLPSEAGDADLGRELLAVVKLAEARLHASEVLVGTRAWWLARGTGVVQWSWRSPVWSSVPFLADGLRSDALLLSREVEDGRHPGPVTCLEN